MSKEPEDNYYLLDEEDNLDEIKKEFLTYLDGKIAPLFAAEALSKMLGTVPPIYCEPKEVAEFVAGWAQMRSIVDGKVVHLYFLKSVEMIVTADRTGVLSGFKSTDFFPSFFEGLMGNCPELEKDVFREKLKQLSEMLLKQWSYDFRQDEYEYTVKVESKGIRQKEQPEEEFRSIIKKLSLSGQTLTLQEQQSVMADLRRLIESLIGKPGFTLTPHLESLIGISIDIFNAGQPLFSAELLYMVQQIYNWNWIDEETRAWLRNFRSSGELNGAQLKMMTGKAEFQNALGIIVTHFDDLNPHSLLYALARESDRQQRRLLTSLIEAQGEQAVPIIMDYLSKTPPVTTKERGWYFTRNLIYLLGRVTPKDPQVQQATINFITPHLSSPVFQLRITALASLENFNDEEIAKSLFSLFNAGSYPQDELKKNPERVSTCISNAISILSKYDIESALQLLVEVAVGKRVEFVGEKHVRELRLQALQVLAGKSRLLSSKLIAPIIECVRKSTKWKLLMAIGLVEESEKELLIMLDILAASPMPQTIEIFSSIKNRYSNKSLGQRAAVLLNNIENNEEALSRTLAKASGS